MFRRIVQKIRSWARKSPQKTIISLNALIDYIETKQRDYIKHLAPEIKKHLKGLSRHKKDPGNLVGMLGERIVHSILRDNQKRFNLEFISYREEIVRENKLFYYFDEKGCCNVFKLENILPDWVLSYNQLFITLEETGLRFPLTLGRQVSEIDAIFSIAGQPVIVEVKTLLKGSSVRTRSILKIYESNVKLMKPLIGPNPTFLVVVCYLKDELPETLIKNIEQLRRKKIHFILLKDRTGEMEKLIDRFGIPRVRTRDMHEYLRENSDEHFSPNRSIPLHKMIPTDSKLWLDNKTDVYLNLHLKYMGETYYTFPAVVVKRKIVYFFQNIDWETINKKYFRQYLWYHALIRRGHKAFMNNKINNGDYTIKFFDCFRRKYHHKRKKKFSNKRDSR